MSNMSYCKFQNTLHDLRDCQDTLLDDDLSPEEQAARKALVRICSDIAETWYDKENKEEYEDEDN